MDFLVHFHCEDACRVGMANLFVQHTSCSLTLNENASPDVRADLNVGVFYFQSLLWVSDLQNEDVTQTYTATVLI